MNGLDRVEVKKTRDDYIGEMREIYSQRQKSLRGRKIEFLNQDHNKRNWILMTTGGGAIGIGAGTAAGAGMGALVGCPGGPPGVGAGAIIGAGVGAILGIAGGAGATALVLRPKYKEWIKTEAGKQFALNLSIFMKELYKDANENNILDSSICYITKEPVLDGVRTPNGDLYERTAIEEWIKRRGIDPITDKPLKKSDLTPDPEANFRSLKFLLEFLISQRDETEENAPELIEGYDKLMKEMRIWGFNSGNHLLQKLQEQFNNDEISYKEFKEKHAEIQKYYSL